MEQLPDWLNATLASDAAEGRGVLPDWIRVLDLGSRVAAPATVVLASQDDNLAVVQAVTADISPGSVLVVGGLSTSRAATIGGLMALELQNQGVAALVTDGLVRDSAEIRDLKLPVWCRGVTPRAPLKNGPGSSGGAVVLGGIVIRDGDVIIADDDGVVVWPAAQVQDLLARAAARLDSDNARLARLHEQRAARASS